MPRVGRPALFPGFIATLRPLSAKLKTTRCFGSPAARLLAHPRSSCQLSEYSAGAFGWGRSPVCRLQTKPRDVVKLAHASHTADVPTLPSPIETATEPSNSAATASPTLVGLHDPGDGRIILAFSDRWCIDETLPPVADVIKQLGGVSDLRSVVFDSSALEAWDSALLGHLRVGVID